MIDFLLAYWAEIPDAMKIFVTVIAVICVGMVAIEIIVGCFGGGDREIMGYLWAINLFLATVAGGIGAGLWALTR